MIHFGLLTAILDGWSFEEAVDIAADMGFECLEVACWPAGKAERRYAGVDALQGGDVGVARHAASRKLQLVHEPVPGENLLNRHRNVILCRIKRFLSFLALIHPMDKKEAPSDQHQKNNGDDRSGPASPMLSLQERLPPSQR